MLIYVVSMFQHRNIECDNYYASRISFHAFDGISTDFNGVNCQNN